MLGFFKSPQISPMEAAEMRFQFRLIFGEDYRGEVEKQWRETPALKRVWYTSRGQGLKSFWLAYDAALKRWDSELKDGYCGEGCVCFNPDGTPKGEDAAWDTAHEIAAGVSGRLDDGTLIHLSRDEYEKHGVL